MCNSCGRGWLLGIARRGMGVLHTQWRIPCHARPTMNRRATPTKATKAASPARSPLQRALYE